MSATSYEGQHTFADKYGQYDYKLNERWLTDLANVPTWKTEIPRVIGLKDEPLEGPWIYSLKEFLSTEVGRVVWHMFCIETYNYRLRHDVSFGEVVKTGVVQNINRSGGCLMNNPRIKELLTDSKKRRTGRVFLPEGIDASFARLFQYYECHKKDREGYFKLRDRTRKITKASCPVCGTKFDSQGVVDLDDGPKCFVDPKKAAVENFNFFEYEADFKVYGGITWERADNRL